MGAQVSLLLQLIDEGYARKAWHGPNLKGSLNGVDYATALRRPKRGRHNIWEVALHAAYWKYVTWRRLTGEKRGSFSLKGSNWFLRDKSFDAALWKRELQMLDEQHQAMRQAIAALDDEALPMTPPGRKESTLRLIQGIACHDVYHAGQIQLIKRLL